jgi:hypothetical protein
MEYLLREKLEKLVQSEIEGRLHQSGGTVDQNNARSTAAAMMASLSSSTAAAVAAGTSTNGADAPKNADEVSRRRLAVMQRDLDSKDEALKVLKSTLDKSKQEKGSDPVLVSHLRSENKSLKEQLRTTSSKTDVQAATRSLQAQLDRKNAELEAARERAVPLERLGARAARIQGRCQALVKERRAVQVTNENVNFVKKFNNPSNSLVVF